MTSLLSLRSRLVIGAACLMVGMFGGSIVLWHVTLGHREPPSLFFTLVSHAHLFAFLCLVCIAIGVAQVQRGWRSVDQVRRHLAALHDEPEGRLSGRYPAEIAPLATNVNRLLDQRDAMVARAGVRAGDLAHGLKTPLAILAHEGERAAQEGQTELAANVRTQVDRMRRQVDAHLARARVDISRHRVIVSVPLLESVAALVRTLERLYHERHISFDLSVPAGIRVAVARDDLDEMLGNILENACKWARTSCRITADIDDGRAVVVIDDDGPGIAQPMRDRLPVRGVRADESTPGSGLGLSIAHDLAQAYGGRLSLDTSPSHGLRVVIAVPASRDTRQNGGSRVRSQLCKEIR